MKGLGLLGALVVSLVMWWALISVFSIMVVPVLVAVAFASIWLLMRD